MSINTLSISEKSWWWWEDGHSLIPGSSRVWSFDNNEYHWDREWQEASSCSLVLVRSMQQGAADWDITPGDIQSKQWVRKHKCPLQPSVQQWSIQAPALRCDASATNCDRRTCVLSVIKGNENWESDNSRFCYCYTAAGRRSLYKQYQTRSSFQSIHLPGLKHL